MTFIRPEIAAVLDRWREVILSVAAALFGAWLALRGGWLLFAVGLLLWAAAGGWALAAIRRATFRRNVDAPGIVEVVEGQIGYFGPQFGGFIAIGDIAELKLTEYSGARNWRLRTRDHQVLIIPVGATGAERLFDAFVQLPGIDMGAVAAALDGPIMTRPLWELGQAWRMTGPSHHDNS